jgi:hypothetical protein
MTASTAAHASANAPTRSHSPICSGSSPNATATAFATTATPAMKPAAKAARTGTPSAASAMTAGARVKSSEPCPIRTAAAIPAATTKRNSRTWTKRGKPRKSSALLVSLSPAAVPSSPAPRPFHLYATFFDPSVLRKSMGLMMPIVSYVLSRNRSRS